MRVLFTADPHFGTDYPYSKRIEDNSSSRLLDILNVYIEDILTKYKNEFDTLIVAGDIFDKAKLDSETLAAVSYLILQIEKHGKNAFFLSGNHDGDKISALLQYNYLSKYLKYSKFMVKFTGLYNPKDDISFIFVPWENMDKIRENFAHIKKNVKRKKDRIVIMVGHFAVKGTEYYGSVCKEGILKEELQELLDTSVDWIILGHHHRPQKISQTILYAGSPFQKDFGEAGENHGFWILDTEENRIKFRKSSAPTFTEITYSRWSDLKNLDLANKIVKVIFKGSSSIDPNEMKRVKEKIKDMGAVHIVSKSERPKAAKALKISSSFSPEKMAAAYVNKNVSKELVNKVGKDDLLSFGLTALREARKHGSKN